MTGFDTLLFVCAICERDVRDWPGRNGRERHMQPVCRSCERHWTERTGKPNGGTMMDRRKAMHVLALANCLRNTAGLIEWDSRYGR